MNSYVDSVETHAAKLLAELDERAQVEIHYAEGQKRWHKVVIVRDGDWKVAHSFVHVESGEVRAPSSWDEPTKGGV